MMTREMKFLKKVSSKTNHTPTKSSKKSKIIEKKNNEKRYFTQNLIGLKEIYGGYFFMTNGQVIGIVEVFAINYNQRSSSERQLIAEKFKRSFRIANKTLHFKLKTEKADIDEIITHIKESNISEKDPRVINQMNDYIENIHNLQARDTYCKKFYYIFEYEGNSSGKKSNEKKQIVKDMNDTKWSILNQFKSFGNMVAIPTTMKEVLFQPMEIAYRHFNPKSCREESFESRYYRLRSDEQRYNNTHAEKKEIQDCDHIATRGIRLLKKAKDTLIIDGIYHTYLVLNDNGYPEGSNGVAVGWISNLLSRIDDIDIDVIERTYSHEKTIDILEQKSKITRVRRNGKSTNPEKYEELDSKFADQNFVLKKMKNEEEDLHDVITIITVRAESLQELYTIKNAIINTLKQDSIYVVEAYNIRIQLLRMTMPFLYIDNPVFKKYAHNFLTSGLASFYWYSAYELMDSKGYILGKNTQNNTLIALNNFTKRYVNPHILILGTSGAGKTFTEQMLGYRMRLAGMKCVYVIPSKGQLDYSSGCENIGGSFIKLGPMQETCINIMQIRAEEENKTEEVPFLAKKVTVITTFIQLLMGKEMLTSTETSRLNVVINRIYNRLGITDDNDSIYIDGTDEIKEMPILEDLWNECKKEDALKRVEEVLHVFVKGNCQNMNGQTNVDLDNGYIVFDVDEDTISKTLFPAFLFVAFDCAYSIAKRSTEEYVAVFLDEVWKLMGNELSAEQVRSMVKLLRAFNSCVVLATQDIEDFLNTEGNFGKSTLSNTATKIILKLLEDEVEEVGKVLRLSEMEKSFIQSFETGDAMIITNGDKVTCSLKASEKEIMAFKPRNKQKTIRKARNTSVKV